MKLFIEVIVLFSVSLYLTNSSDSILASKVTRKLIVNGIVSPPRLFYAKLVYSNGFCGASIINSRFAVTAAQCVFLLARKSHHPHHKKLKNQNFTANCDGCLVCFQLFTAYGLFLVIHGLFGLFLVILFLVIHGIWKSMKI